MGDLYRQAQIVLGESDAALARDVSAAFFKLGLRDFVVCRGADELRQALVPVIDMVLCDVDLPGIDFCELSQDIRHERLGNNPFAVLVALARPSAATDLAQVIKSGVDDFLAKPMDAEEIVRRVGAFTRKRAPFVVTRGYIGPSRRETRREDGTDDNLLEVPNTLRGKTVEGLLFADIQARIKAGRERVKERKAVSSLWTMTRLAHRLTNRFSQQDSTEATLRMLNQLAERSDEVVAEHRRSDLTRGVAEIASRIGLLARRAAVGPGRLPATEMNLLGQLSDAAVGASATDAGAAEIAGQIAQVVDRYLARG